MSLDRTNRDTRVNLGAKDALDNFDDYVDETRKGKHKKKTNLKCGGRCIKSTVQWGNVFFSLVGLGFMIFGIILLSDGSGITITISIFLICIGIVVLFVAILGTCGASRESMRLMKFYLVILTILILAQVISGVIFVTSGSQSPEFVKTEWKDSSNEVRVELQNKFTCCGLDKFNETAGIPCPNEAKEGCFQQMKSAIEEAASVAGVGGIVIGALEIIVAVVSILLIRLLKLMREQGKDALQMMDIHL